MRIIKGTLKDRVIPFAGTNTRPLTQLARKSLFDTLENFIDIQDKIIYDVCAGSGSFGIEAISRGAKHVYFIEKHGKTARDIRSTLRAIGITSASIINQDIMHCPLLDQPADLIFIDPPFGHMMVENILSIISKKHETSRHALIIARADYDFAYDGLEILSDKSMLHGIVRVMRMHNMTLDL